MVLKVYVDFVEAVSSVNDVNDSTFIIWFDYNGSNIFGIVQCYIFL